PQHAPGGTLHGGGGPAPATASQAPAARASAFPGGSLPPADGARVSEVPPSIGRRASRPEAPPLAFGIDEVRFAPEAEPVAASSPAIASTDLAPPRPPTEPARATCVHCGATNPPTDRKSTRL